MLAWDTISVIESEKIQFHVLELRNFKAIEEATLIVWKVGVFQPMRTPTSATNVNLVGLRLKSWICDYNWECSVKNAIGSFRKWWSITSNNCSNTHTQCARQRTNEMIDILQNVAYHITQTAWRITGESFRLNCYSHSTTFSQQNCTRIQLKRKVCFSLFLEVAPCLLVLWFPFILLKATLFHRNIQLEHAKWGKPCYPINPTQFSLNRMNKQWGKKEIAYNRRQGIYSLCTANSHGISVDFSANKQKQYWDY